MSQRELEASKLRDEIAHRDRLREVAISEAISKIVNPDDRELLAQVKSENEKLSYHLARIIDARAATPRWIPVGERLPEIDGGVLISTFTGDVQEAYFDADDEQFWEPDQLSCAFIVTHWQPLPPAPASQKGEA
jgi:hypothetical protein